MILLFTFLLLALVISFLCSTLESVLMTTTLSYITMREEEGYAPAKRMKAYKTEPEKPLAAILSLNTIANTVGAAGVGQQANILFGSEWFGVISAITTLLILIVSEIIPKTLGTTYWKNLMGFTAGTIRVLIIIMYPVVKMIEGISHLFPTKEETTVSREEVIAMASVGEEEGVIEEDENKIIRNVMRLGDVKAYDVMTPRVVAAIAPEGMTLKEYYENHEYDPFSRIPVYSDSPEYITGYVMRDDALENLADDHFNKTLGEIKRSLPQFNKLMSISDIFDRMLKEKSQISVVIDEYGCFQGILTLEDVIETIFGLEIIDENDQFADLQQYARERWQQRQKRFRRLLINS
ncbi:MAG: CNNM domain-containing protein [Paludibacteraceae bacterium]|nr:CNNM domain-containing protein [Paludibacteraceae bacterium]